MRNYTQERKESGRLAKARTKYRNTPKGYLAVKWAAIKQRCEGRATKRLRHIYEGLEFCTREEFRDWALTDKGFQDLWGPYVANGKPRALCPSIDRIDSTKGYTLGNMQFITLAENASKGRKIT